MLSLIVLTLIIITYAGNTKPAKPRSKYRPPPNRHTFRPPKPPKPQPMKQTQTHPPNNNSLLIDSLITQQDAINDEIEYLQDKACKTYKPDKRAIYNRRAAALMVQSDKITIQILKLKS